MSKSNRNYKKREMCIITLSPAYAQQLLNTQKSATLTQIADNRAQVERYVNQLTEMIVENKWVLNGETIKVDKDGVLRDGQHRCRAVIRAKKGIETYIVYGLTTTIFQTIDTGLPRRLGQMIDMYGVKYPNVWAACINLLLRWYDGSLRKPGTRSKKVCMSDALTSFEGYRKKRLAESINITYRMGWLFPRGPAACLHYLFAQKSKNDADVFFEKVESGENLSRASKETSGIFWLRRQLVERAAKPKVAAKSEEYFPLFIRAWSAYRRNTVLTSLHYNWNKSKKDQEAFPEII